MSEWTRTKLGDCCTSITDGDHQSLPVSEKGIPFIIISNIKNNRIDFSDTRFVPTDYFDNLDSTRKPRKGDILYTVKGSFGIPVYVDIDAPFVFQRDIAILKCNDRVNAKFLYYVLKSPEFAKKADLLAIGSAQRALTLKTLRNMDFSCPSLDMQTRIVRKIEAFDYLIENNQKQIKLLEEAAQRLYKEWFVDLRFPGYENTPIVDGVPEGWKKKKVTDLLRIRYGKDHKNLDDGDIPVYGSGGIMRKVKQILYSGESVLIPRKGSLNNIFYVDGDFWTIDTMFYSIPLIEKIAKYAYLFLSQLDMYSFNIGAAVPSMTVNILDGIDILLPDKSTIDAFDSQVGVLFNRMELLKKQSEKACEARDRLLPKLMSGEMEV